MDNNYVLITGACGGLGKAYCEVFSSKGNNLIICGTNKEKLDKQKEEISKKNPKVDIIPFTFNLLDLTSVDALINFIKEKNLNVEILVNNAGYITEGSIKKASKETLLRTIKVNCEGTIYLTKSFLDLKKKNVQIITVSSMASFYPLPYMAIYASTKALIKNFMLALREEYKENNVKVLVVMPGAIATSDEMKRAIEAQGLKGKLSAVPAKKIAEKSVKSLFKNKSCYVPGIFNKFTIFLSALCPKKLQIKLAGKMWKKSQAKRGIK